MLPGHMFRHGLFLIEHMDGQGRENVRNFLKDNREVFGRIDTELRKKLGIKVSQDVEIPAVPLNGVAQAAETVRARRN